MAKFRVIPHEADARYDAEQGLWKVHEHDGSEVAYTAEEFRDRFIPESTEARDLFRNVYNDAGWGYDNMYTPDVRKRMSDLAADTASTVVQVRDFTPPVSTGLVDKTDDGGEWQDTLEPNIQVRANLNPPALRYKDTGIELTDVEIQTRAWGRAYGFPPRHGDHEKPYTNFYVGDAGDTNK